jgi:hypothetical protein
VKAVVRLMRVASPDVVGSIPSVEGDGTRYTALEPTM